MGDRPSFATLGRMVPGSRPRLSGRDVVPAVLGAALVALEGTVRDDLALPALQIGVAIALAATLVFRRPYPLAALSVALAGPVAFVAFMAPHLARGLLRAPGIAVVTVAGLVGAALIVGADLVALRILPGTELPLGAVTALIGAPYFLFLLYRTNRSGVAG